MYILVKNGTLSALVLTIISSCGGGGSNSSTLSATALTVFNDGAGVGRVSDQNGSEFVYIAPNIVADVNATNGSESSSTQVDVTQYPIISQSNGYNLRQGVLSAGGTTMNVIIAERVNSGRASIAYLYNNSGDAIAAGGGQFSGTPSGTHSYSGIYVAGGRYSSFAEIGSLSFTANFDNNTFSINGSSASSSLTGTGFIDAATGRISSGNLTFTSPYNSTYGATTFGNITGGGASDVSGVYYTNDTNPDYSGAYAGTR